MNDKKIQSLLALAQLDAAQNQPDPREAMASQMLMQLLGMTQQQETQASQMDLDRERMAQAMEQFNMGQGNALTMHREDIALKKAQQEELLAKAERQYGMDMLREMGMNQRAYDEANQKQLFQKENRDLFLKQIMGRLAEHTMDPGALRFALEQLGYAQGGAPTVAAPAGVDMEAKKRELEAAKAASPGFSFFGNGPFRTPPAVSNMNPYNFFMGL